jgi:hypothetical protein
VVRTAITNSYLTDFKDTAQETEAMADGAGRDRIKLSQLSRGGRRYYSVWRLRQSSAARCETNVGEPIPQCRHGRQRQGADTRAVYQVRQGVVPGTGQRRITSLAPSPSTYVRPHRRERNGSGGSAGGCFWMTTISPGWLNGDRGFSAMGPGIVSYSVPAYVGGTATRATPLLIGGSKLIVRQTP